MDDQKLTIWSFGWLAHIRNYDPDEEIIDITASEEVLTAVGLGKKLDSSSIEALDCYALGLPRLVVDAIFSSWPQITRPSEIQSSAIPEIIKGDHVIAQAPISIGTHRHLLFLFCSV